MLNKKSFYTGDVFTEDGLGAFLEQFTIYEFPKYVYKAPRQSFLPEAPRVLAHRFLVNDDDAYSLASRLDYEGFAFTYQSVRNGAWFELFIDPDDPAACSAQEVASLASPVKAHIVFGFLRMPSDYREVVTGDCEEKFHFVLGELEGKKHAEIVANAAYVSVVLQTVVLYLLNGAKAWIIGILVGVLLFKKIFGGD